MPLNSRHRGILWWCFLPLLSGCGGSETGQGSVGPEPQAKPVGRPALFAEAARELGVDFVHFNGMTGELYFVENMGSGVAVLDFDGDGDLDLFFVQGALLDPAKGLEGAAILTPPKLPLVDRLYRNEGPGTDGRPRFADVTKGSGIEEGEYGMGVATGDFDGDGAVDLYVTNFGPNRLWRNRGDGTFEDVTKRAGVDDARWSTAATFFDFDRDGWLDLFVGNYVDFRVEDATPCRAESGLQDYCSPEAYPPLTDRLWRNRGDGTFEEVTEEAGMGEQPGKALGAIAADFDGDGWLDIAATGVDGVSVLLN
ncbi:MAG: VCBS repeat-containing protein, partial [Acidobacteria bacterium]|nr:VCBS repeat-containing protein [Acidobacteriota bacterium]